MEINKEILSSWQELREHGDLAEIQRRCLIKKKPLSYMTIWKAFKGSASFDTVEVINEYYKEKQTKINNLKR